MNPFTRPNDTSTGGAGGGGNGGSRSGSGRVLIANTPKERPFPWPLPFSAQQGCVGSIGGSGRVSVQRPAWYQPYRPYWPYGIPEQYFKGYPNIPVRS